MQNRSVARVFLFLGGLAAVVGWWAFAAQQTIFDVQATREAATGLLGAKSLQTKAVDSLTEQLTKLLPPGTDSTQVRQAATGALNDPRVTAAFADAVASIQEQLLTNNGTKQKLVVDTRAVTTAVQDALAKVDPSLAESFGKKPVTFSFDTTGLPNLSGPKRSIPNIALIASLLAIAAWLGAILTHPDQWEAVRRIGRLITSIGVAPVLLWIVVPRVLEAFQADATQTLSPLASTYGKRLAPAAIVLLVVGIALWVGGRVGGASAKAARALANKRTSGHDVPGSSDGVSTGAGRSSRNYPRRGQGSRVIEAERFDVQL